MSSTAQAMNFNDFDDLFADLGLGEDKKPQAQTNDSSKEVKPSRPNTSNVTPMPNVNPIGGVDINVLQNAQAKMQRINAEMNAMFVEREELIKLMQLAVCTGTNLLMLGPPGTAKSMLTQELCSRIEQANYFQWMLNKTSDPSEILGSFSIRQMENDRFLRVTSGKLPEAHIAFMDEVFKANSPTLNTLLTIMNEHIFYNDGRANRVPLISMFGASNEGPEDESLDALYDRFIFRMNVHYVHDTTNRKRMHSNYIDSRAGLLGLTGKTTITLNEIQTLQMATMTVKVQKDLINKFIRLINELERQGIHVSDRRQNECFKVMQGNAILAGRNQVSLEDFKSLIYVLWEKEEHIPVIESAILKMVNPYDDRFKELKDNFNQIRRDIDAITDPDERTKRSIESKASIEKLVAKSNKLINEASKNGRDTVDFSTFRDEMVQYSQKLISEALGTSFPGFDS